MGYWSFDRADVETSPYDTPQLFGNNIRVTMKITYHPAKLGRFVEMPKLEWTEKFIVIEHHRRQRWEFESDMYRHNPSSATLVIWRQRYFTAYDDAHGVPRLGLGSSRLLDTTGRAVPPSRLTGVVGDDRRAKTKAVQDYLKQNGGSLSIVVHDRPALNLPRQVTEDGRQVWEDKERLLLFRCHVGGIGQAFTGMQYLHVDGAQPRQTWDRSWRPSHIMPDLPIPHGYARVESPSIVSNSRLATPFSGEVD